MRLEAHPFPRRRLGLTPLIDVVFLLLLFFMLASTFDRFATFDVRLSGTASARPSATPPILLRLHGEGRMDVNAETVTAGSLEERLRALQADGRDALVIQARPTVVTQELVDILGEVRRAGIRKVAISRREG